MDVLGRDSAPFSGRVWQQIDATIASVKNSNCTARRFLEVDGPYGLGLTSLSGDDVFLPPQAFGTPPQDWGVRRAVLDRQTLPDADPDERITGRGTFLMQANARPVPVITSEFLLSIRSVEAFDDECQPLDLLRAARAARDVALEEERLIYYGNPVGSPIGLLALNIRQQFLQYLLQQVQQQVPPAVFTVVRNQIDAFDPLLIDLIFQPVPQEITPFQLAVVWGILVVNVGLAILANIVIAFARIQSVSTLGPVVNPAVILARLLRAVRRLADRGFSGPYALVVSPRLYTLLAQIFAGPPAAASALLIEVLQRIFVAGIYVVPVIRPNLAAVPPLPGQVRGAIVTCGRAYQRLVVGQDWVTGYRGRMGMYHRFVIASSLRLEITEPRAIQVLV
jgi:uncharacterized linocin/CFP29 family protein